MESDNRQIKQSEVSKAKRFDKRDFATLVEYICETYESRKKERKHFEKQWEEIDRQLRMEPDVKHKLNADGTRNQVNAWMPEIEIPNQAYALEVLTADARRMMFPASGSWFEARAALTDDYLSRADFSAMVAGDLNEVPTQIDQDAANKLVEGLLEHWHRQYDFRGNLDKINAEAFKYGLGVGRGRAVKKPLFMDTAKGTVKLTQRIPVLFPLSIKNIYVDDSQHRLMNAGHIVGPSTIFREKKLFADIALAAEKGSKEPDDMDGGWMPAMLKNVQGDKNGQVEVLEMEGDFVVPRKTTESVFIPNAIITVVKGQDGKNPVNRVIRLRYKETPFSTYIQFPYHVEHLDSAYPTSPLMKGRPLQMAAVDSLSRAVEAGALKNQPPIGYDKDDPDFALNGGPRVYPGAQWPTTSDLQVHKDIGDPTAMFSIYAGMLQQYADVTGINAPRLGAQTVSHTTAFAKEAELARGTIRTVDYVQSSLNGPITQWLNMAFYIGKKYMKEDTIYIEPYNGYVDIEKDQLPDIVSFKAHGAGGPAEENAKQQSMLQAFQLAFQLDQVGAQQGLPPDIDKSRAIQEILRRGGWTDVDVILRQEAQVAQQNQNFGQQPGLVTGVPDNL